MFQIKICGLRDGQSLQTVIDSGADAIGLNFYERSVRYVTAESVEPWLGEVPTTLAKVGVFVDPTAEQVQQTAQRLALDFVQLHGNEPPELLAELANLRLIKVLRVAPGEATQALRHAEAYLAALGALATRVQLAGLMIDAGAPGHLGGSGQLADWSIVPRLRESHAGMPIVLAGGLRPENVAEAIAAARPAGVDVASGVESSPGVKDPSKVRAFVQAAQQAFALA